MFFRFGLAIILGFFCKLSIAQTDIESIAKSEMRSFQSARLFKKSLLTESYVVVYQRLELDIKMDIKWVYGKVTTWFVPQKPAFNIIQFDLEDYLKVDSITYGKSKLLFTHANKLITAQLPLSIAVGSVDSVAVYYQGNPGLNNPWQSFTFDAHNNSDPQPIAWTLSEPYGSKGWWPCKESLTDKIDSLDFLITVKKGNKAASNGKLIVEKDLNDSQVLFHWRHRYPIATYLVAVAVTNYVAYNDYLIYPGNDTLTILNYVYPESEADARSKTPATVKIIQLFDSLFGTYPFKKEKYGHAQWGWSGGMEHQTMSFMVSFNFDLVAHELAHQWFGDFATCGSWSDLWLNEGFASYLNFLCYEFLDSKQEFRNRMSGCRGEVVKEDFGSVYVSDTANRSRLFSGRLTYNKGAFVLHMLRWKLGDKAFFEGVRNYLNKLGVKYGFGRTADLKSELEASSNQNLTEFFADWYYLEGYPNIQITWSHVGNHLTLRIKQTPSHPSVSFFNIPLPFLIKGKTKSASFVFDPLSKDNTFTADLDFIPESVEFDPDVWILCKFSVLKVKPQNGTEIQIFPVPTDNSLFIYDYRGNIEHVKIFDMAGRKVLDIDYKAINWINDKQEVDVSSYSAGVYAVEVETEFGIARQRFLKK